MRQQIFIGVLVVGGALGLSLLPVSAAPSGPTTRPGMTLAAAGVPVIGGVPAVGTAGGGGGGIKEFRGLVAPFKQVTLNAPMDGILKHIPAKEGQMVRKDAVLIEMDDGLQQVAVAGATLEAASEAAVKKAQAELDEAAMMLDRSEELVKKGAANDWEARRARLQRDQAAAGLTAAKEQRDLAQIKLKMETERLVRYRLTAPFDGRLLRVLVQEGATLSQRDQVVTLVALETLEATVYVAANRYGEVQVGKTFSMKAEDPVNARVTGTVKTVDPVIDSASQTFRCVLTIDNAEQKLPAGFTVTLELP
jgi:RND family efflux transporter MFP subunit